MIYHDVIAQFLVEEQKRKLNFITMKGWQLVREKNAQAAAPRQMKPAIQGKQCAAC